MHFAEYHYHTSPERTSSCHGYYVSHHHYTVEKAHRPSKVIMVEPIQVIHPVQAIQPIQVIQPIQQLPLVQAPPSAPPVHQNNPNESEDDYCRRKDSNYAAKADELAKTKKQRDQVKVWMDEEREHGEWKKWQHEFQELSERTTLLQKRVAEMQKAVLRKNRL